MQLAYGKFDPDLNPPPFSDWSSALTAVEIDLFQYYSWKPKTSAYFRSWVKRKDLKIIPRFGIRTQRSAEEYQDAINLWRETYQEETLYFLVHSGRKEWIPDQTIPELKKLPKIEKLFLEWGKADTLRGVEFTQLLHCFRGYVIDPDWHGSYLSSLAQTQVHFKLHGWNEERWVRRYGESKSARILKVLKKQEGSSLILSYSGKVAEAPLFLGD